MTCCLQEMVTGPWTSETPPAELERSCETMARLLLMMDMKDEPDMKPPQTPSRDPDRASAFERSFDEDVGHDLTYVPPSSISTNSRRLQHTMSTSRPPVRQTGLALLNKEIM